MMGRYRRVVPKSRQLTSSGPALPPLYAVEIATGPVDRGGFGVARASIRVCGSTAEGLRCFGLCPRRTPDRECAISYGVPLTSLCRRSFSLDRSPDLTPGPSDAARRIAGDQIAEVLAGIRGCPQFQLPSATSALSSWAAPDPRKGGTLLARLLEAAPPRAPRRISAISLLGCSAVRSCWSFGSPSPEPIGCSARSMR